MSGRRKGGLSAACRAEARDLGTAERAGGSLAPPAAPAAADTPFIHAWWITCVAVVKWVTNHRTVRGGEAGGLRRAGAVDGMRIRSPQGIFWVDASSMRIALTTTGSLR